MGHFSPIVDPDATPSRTPTIAMAQRRGVVEARLEWGLSQSFNATKGSVATRPVARPQLYANSTHQDGNHGRWWKLWIRKWAPFLKLLETAPF
jgi:hypothetical protein